MDTGPNKMNKAPELDSLQASRMLEDIFEACEVTPNTVPIEALASYSNYRKEKFTLQRAVLICAMVLFLLLPLLFIPPRLTVTMTARGERNLPVYTLQVSGVMPISKVTASINGKNLPVYEAGGRTYTIEPTANGTMTFTVELANHQQQVQTAEVTDVDSECPKLAQSVVQQDTVSIFMTDEGVGINYDGIYAETESGTVIRPLRYDSDTGEIVFAYPEETCEVYVSDYIGNTTHLRLSLQE